MKRSHRFSACFSAPPTSPYLQDHNRRSAFQMRTLLVLILTIGVFLVPAVRADEEKAGPDDNKPPEGFRLLFNGKDLTGWQGLVELPDRGKLSPDELAKKQKEANEKYLPHWTAKDGILNYDGK